MPSSAGTGALADSWSDLAFFMAPPSPISGLASLDHGCALRKDLPVAAHMSCSQHCSHMCRYVNLGSGLIKHAAPSSLTSRFSLSLAEPDPGMASTITDIAIIAGELAWQGPLEQPAYSQKKAELKAQTGGGCGQCFSTFRMAVDLEGRSPAQGRTSR